MQKTKPNISDTKYGIKDDIPNHFGNIYEELYNCVADGDEIAEISEEVEHQIGVGCLEDVFKVTPEEVKKAAAKLKPGKADPTFSFSSDCLKVKSEVLAEQIDAMIRSFLIHNHSFSCSVLLSLLSRTSLCR